MSDPSDTTLPFVPYDCMIGLDVVDVHKAIGCEHRRQLLLERVNDPDADIELAFAFEPRMVFRQRTVGGCSRLCFRTPQHSGEWKEHEPAFNLDPHAAAQNYYQEAPQCQFFSS